MNDKKREKITTAAGSRWHMFRKKNFIQYFVVVTPKLWYTKSKFNHRKGWLDETDLCDCTL